MGTSRKPVLPVFGGALGTLGKGPPSLDEARAQLGGAWIGGPDIGAVVRVVGSLGERVGVVVHSSPTDRDVWIGAGRVQRIEPGRLVVVETPDAEHDTLVADARVHASLTAGDPVAYQLPDGTYADGVLVEKLRFGSLIGTAEAKVVAVGFRRIAPRQADPPS